MNDKAVATRANTAVTGAKTADVVVAERQRIIDVMQAVMREGVHYGTIPGTPKPTLYKPGSEVLLSTFHIAVHPEIQDISTDREIRYRVLAHGVHMESGIKVGVGVGEASTSEERYQWRRAVCDEEFTEALEENTRIKYKSDYGEIKKIYQVRTNPADLANTVLKMAKKRSQIDLTLTATAASEIFSQDELPPGATAPVDGERPETKPQTARPSRTGTGSTKATGKQIGLIKHRLSDAGVPERSFLEHFELSEFDDLLKDDMDGALKWIKTAAE